MKHVREGTEDPSRINIGNTNDLKVYDHLILIFYIKFKNT